MHEMDAPRWYACHTHSRAEKRVAQLLTARTIEAFLPTAMRKSVWADRSVVLSIPLFPGYVFARFELRDWHRILSTPGVATVVRQAGRPAPITDAEIENVRRFAAGLNRLNGEREPQPFRDGQRVRVTAGPLEGVEGVVFLRRGRTSLMVGIRTIGQGIAVYVDGRVLQKISPAGDE
jgi:transcription antitermination factor NusG